MNVTPAEYAVSEIGDSSSALLKNVIALGDANRNSLGFLPWAGFAEAARRNCIVVVNSSSGEVAGYCLYDLTVAHVRIVHLCIASAHQRRGLAARLVDEVRRRHPDRLGLRLKCRRDWAADAMWPRLGFQPLTDAPGRSKEGHLLTAWWSPNEHDDLFTLNEPNADLLLVAVDSNVFCDLHTRESTRRSRFSGAVALMAGDQSIMLALPVSVPAELNATVDGDERRHLLQTAAMYPKLKGSRGRISRIQLAILSRVPESEVWTDRSLERDAGLVAESIAGEASVFVTRDANLIRILGPHAFDMYGLAVMDPTELPSYAHRLKAGHDYQPARLAETDFEVSRGDAARWASADVVNLINMPEGERRSAFADRLRQIAERSTTQLERYLLLGPSGTVMAAWALGLAGNRLTIPLLRVGSGDLRHTITHQLAFILRQAAVKKAATQIVIEDPHPGRNVIETLEAEGFTRSVEGQLSGTVLTLCAPWHKVRTAAANAGAPSVLTQDLPSLAQAMELERIWWPAKIIDTQLPCYFVPIKSGFADELLGHTSTLLTRAAGLGLSREHIYYRSARSQPEAPGRVLWYASGRDMEVVACSRLVESITGSPETLHRAFQHLGVWSLRQVKDAAGDGLVGALRFADTEIFDRPVSLRALRRLSEGVATLPSQGPRRIDNQLFAILYREGKQA